ncbi:hypothetical protein [Saccharibacillus alkalitolerans]|uniref:Uncharacterized protein n=1 Tax=Saccharibacillus alkalitolerans TaxID=2705290 RepID=A0ABX0F2M8_9BACL|nr:hypothetical protein [Saccharibacillus alkalitolerans]NGZ75248.1 hypothetical protein [Saccharibacillus alkalitolerans]
MGQRVNLALVRGGGYRLYYHHWCAETLTRDLFWGEEYALRFIEAQRGVEPEEWMNEDWAEGGAVVDLDRKTLLLYGGGDILLDIPLRQMYMRLLGASWPGWEVKWAGEGIVGLADYVGYAGHRLLGSFLHDPDIPLLTPAEKKEWILTVASVRFPDGELLLYPQSTFYEYTLEYGERSAAYFDRSLGVKELYTQDWPEPVPSGGLHLDIAERLLYFWHADCVSGMAAKLAPYWPGWTIVDLGEEYGLHAGLAEGRLTFGEPDPEKKLARLREMLLYEWNSPVEGVLRFAESQAEAGKSVAVNAAALSDDRTEPDRETKKEILERAIRGAGLG